MRLTLLASASLAATLTISLFAQIPVLAPHKSAEQGAALCTVSGRAVTAAEGSPLQWARVTLMQEHAGRNPLIYAATSDANGHFTLKDVTPGRYNFRATRNGYVSQSYRSDGTGDGAVLSLRPGQDVADVLFRLISAAVITGRVTNEDGAPMARARVLALRRSTEEEMIEQGMLMSKKLDVEAVAGALTDDRGQYRIFGLEPGEYYLTVTDFSEPDMNLPLDQDYFVQKALGSDYAPVFFPGVSQLSQAQPIAVGAGEESPADVVMRQVKNVEISGHVVGPQGNRASDVSISLAENEADGYSSVRDTSTDAKGNFTLKSIPPGRYLLLAYQNGHEEGDERNAYHAQQNLEVGSDNIDSIALTLGGGAKLAGRITVVGPGTVKRDRLFVILNPVDEGGSWGGSGRVKKDGTFEIVDVKEGNYAVLVRGPDEGWFARSIRLGPEDVLANGLHIEKGSSGGTLEIVVSTGTAVVDGSVVQDDKPVAGVRVRITLDPETPYNKVLAQSVRTDQNGHFSSQIAPGKYQVVARSSSSNQGHTRTSDPSFINLSDHDHKTLDLTIAPESK
jgi:5-hydroxyisourate hydrolase-like protein (transthyretin family)